MAARCLAAENVLQKLFRFSGRFTGSPKVIRRLTWTQIRLLPGLSPFCSPWKCNDFEPSLHLNHRAISQERSPSRNPNYKIPDELWVILLLGTGGVVLYSVTHFKKKELESKRKESRLQLKLAAAQEAKQQNKLELAFELLKQALEVVHLEITSPQVRGPPTHKAVRYILSQLANLSFEMERWSEAEHYFRLAMQDMLASGISKDDDAVIEISLKLSHCCARQEKHELAEVGFKWCVETAEEKVRQSKDPPTNSKALLGVCLTDWGVYLLSTGQSHLAVHVLSRALQLSEEVLGPAHEQTAVLLNNLAKAHVDCKNYDDAERLASRAVKQAQDTSDENLPLFLTNLARILRAKGDVNKAKSALSQARQLAADARDSDLTAVIETDLSKLAST